MAQPMRLLQHQQLPPEAEQLAGAYQLGTAQTAYRVRVKKAAMIVWIVLGVILGGIFILPGRVQFLRQSFRNGRFSSRWTAVPGRSVLFCLPTGDLSLMARLHLHRWLCLRAGQQSRGFPLGPD